MASRRPRKSHNLRDGPSRRQLNLNAKPAVALEATAQGGSVSVEDTQGYEAVGGSSSLTTERTGQTSTISAASSLLFGKDKKVIWRAL